MPVPNLRSPFLRTRRTAIGRLMVTWGYDQYSVTDGTKTQGPIDPFAGTLIDESYRTMDDVVTPGFAQRVAAGAIVNSPMTSVTHEYLQQCSSSFEATGMAGNTLNVWKITGFPRPHCGPTEITESIIADIANLTTLCQTGALAGIQTPQIQGLATLGEGASTLAMLANPLKGFSKILGRRLKTVGKASWQRTINNRIYAKKTGKAWKNATRYGGQGLSVAGDLTAAAVLGANLGWKPFMQDIDTILHKIPALEFEERRTARNSVSVDYNETYRNDMIIPYTGISATRVRKYTEKVTIRAGVLYADEFIPAQHFGYRLVDLPEAAWELLPLSFVFDYFFNVADLIGALRGMVGTKTLASWTTTRIETRVEESYEIHSLPYPYTSFTWGNPVGITRKIVKSRTPEPLHAGLAYSPLQIALKPPARVQNLIGLTLLQLTGLKKRAGKSQ